MFILHLKLIFEDINAELTSLSLLTNKLLSSWVGESNEKYILNRWEKTLEKFVILGHKNFASFFIRKIYEKPSRREKWPSHNLTVVGITYNFVAQNLQCCIRKYNKRFSIFMLKAVTIKSCSIISSPYLLESYLPHMIEEREKDAPPRCYFCLLK